MPLLLSGTSAKEGDMVAQSGGHAESTPGAPPHHPHPTSRREVVCFDCHAINKASARATSTQCANCGTFIDLRDFDIRERTTQRIRTRGNVTVHKKGALLGTAVHCGSLIVEGSVACSIYAQDSVEFRTDAKVLGEIRCRRLVIEKKVIVTGLQPVHVDSVEVQGELAARVFATGTARIGRQGKLEGGLNAARLKVDNGGLINGLMRIGGRIPTPDEREE